MFVIFCSRPPENVKRGSFMSKPRNDDKEIYKQACCCCCFANLIFLNALVSVAVVIALVPYY